MGAYAESITGVEVVKIKVVLVEKYLSGIKEEGEIDEGPDFPAILGAQKEISRVAEPVFSKTPNGPCSTKGLHQIEGNLVAVFVCFRVGCSSMKSQDPILGSEWNVALDVGNQTGEVELIEVAVLVAESRLPHDNPNIGLFPLVVQVELYPPADDAVVGRLETKAAHLRRVENLLD